MVYKVYGIYEETTAVLCSSAVFIRLNLYREIVNKWPTENLSNDLYISIFRLLKQTLLNPIIF